LKHEDIFADEIAKKRFQTTYEELKLEIIDHGHIIDPLPDYL